MGKTKDHEITSRRGIREECKIELLYEKEILPNRKLLNPMLSTESDRNRAVQMCKCIH